MLNIEDSVLVIIDVQEKLVKAANNGINCAENNAKLAKAAKILDIPLIITEQYPKGLGLTVQEILDNTSADTSKIEKSAFSAFKEQPFRDKIQSLKRKQVVICGIEAHICVLQTASDLLKAGYEVYLVKDCASSRKIEEYNTGLELAHQYGVNITCLEIVLFEWLKTSKHPNFKEIQALIK